MVKNLKYLVAFIPLCIFGQWFMDFDEDYASASTGTPDVLDGLVAWWKMDEASWNGTAGEVADSISTNNGTAFGGAYTTNGIINRAGYFNGVDGYVKTPKYELPTPTNNATFSFWANPENANQLNSPFAWRNPNPGYEQITISFANGTGISQSAGKKISALWYNGSGRYYYKSTDVDVINGSWRFFCIVFKYGVGIEIYVDGLFVSQSNKGDNVFAPISTSLEFTIGSGNTILYYKNSVDDARVYNRALSSNEVSTIYNKFKP